MKCCKPDWENVVFPVAADVPLPLEDTTQLSMAYTRTNLNHSHSQTVNWTHANAPNRHKCERVAQKCISPVIVGVGVVVDSPDEVATCPYCVSGNENCKDSALKYVLA